jgi:hypothetical protein
MGQQLHGAAEQSSRADFHRVVGGTHNDTWRVGGTAYWDAWRGFLNRVQQAPAPAAGPR